MHVLVGQGAAPSAHLLYNVARRKRPQAGSSFDPIPGCQAHSEAFLVLRPKMVDKQDPYHSSLIRQPSRCTMPSSPQGAWQNAGVPKIDRTTSFYFLLFKSARVLLRCFRPCANSRVKGSPGCESIRMHDERRGTNPEHSQSDCQPPDRDAARPKVTPTTYSKLQRYLS